MIKDAYYFPHDSNAKDDDKCIILIEELGLEGYGIYWVLIEMLRDQKEFKAPLKILPALARRYNTSTEKMKAVVTRYDLFVVEDDEFFFSESLIKRMNPLLDKKQERKVSGIKGNLIKYGYATKDELNGMTDAEILELNEKKTALNGQISLNLANDSLSDRNKSKEEESRVKKSRVDTGSNKLAPLPTVEEVISYFTKNGYSRESAINAFRYYEDDRIERNGKVWKDSKGNTVRSWKQKMRGVWFKEENRSTVSSKKRIHMGEF